MVFRKLKTPPDPRRCGTADGPPGGKRRDHRERPAPGRQSCDEGLSNFFLFRWLFLVICLIAPPGRHRDSGHHQPEPRRLPSRVLFGLVALVFSKMPVDQPAVGLRGGLGRGIWGSFFISEVVAFLGPLKKTRSWHNGSKSARRKMKCCEFDSGYSIYQSVVQTDILLPLIIDINFIKKIVEDQSSLSFVFPDTEIKGEYNTIFRHVNISVSSFPLYPSLFWY